MKNKETVIDIRQKNNRWFYHIQFDNWQASGYAESLEKAEAKAFDVTKTIPDSEIIHISYEGGKKVKHSGEISFQEALVKEGFRRP